MNHFSSVQVNPTKLRQEKEMEVENVFASCMFLLMSRRMSLSTKHLPVHFNMHVYGLLWNTCPITGHKVTVIFL